MTVALELFAAAFFASVFGSMVGLGGGFILVPILRLFFGLGPAEAAGTSLVLVTANSASGAFTYLLQKRVDVKLGLMFAAGGLPGSIIGAIMTKHIAPRDFDWAFGIFLILVAGDMIVNAAKRVGARVETNVGQRKAMSFRAAVGIGFVVGLVSSLFGIGGGVIVVPSLLYFSSLPAHAISATSHFAIVLTSPVGLIVHGFQHDIRIADVAPLVAGGLCGGPIGARLSMRLKSPQLLVVVGIALVCVALSLALRHVIH
ncbi:MAG: sulfite exporter TauE/SafE family protein [Candidatus Eremiobacteraeota bacterium]|nr:sulfite exporter TauE/SafE family protein [Candidatus Eremiobacteraeota bacterium]